MKPAEITALRRRWTGDDNDHLRQQLLDQARIVKGPVLPSAMSSDITLSG